VGYCYPSGLEKTLCKWDIYVSLVTKGLIFPGMNFDVFGPSFRKSYIVNMVLLYCFECKV